MLHLPPLRFHCVGGCWYRTQDSGDYTALAVRRSIYLPSPANVTNSFQDKSGQGGYKIRPLRKKFGPFCWMALSDIIWSKKDYMKKMSLSNSAKIPVNFSAGFAGKFYYTKYELKQSEYWLIYRGLGFLAVVWCGSSPTPYPPLPFVSSPATQRKTEKERQAADGRGGERGWERKRIIRPQESLE
jgi:hypothetical protein